MTLLDYNLLVDAEALEAARVRLLCGADDVQID